MSKHSKSEPGIALSGKISDRIRAGKIDADVAFKGSTHEAQPSDDAIRHGSGQGLGTPGRHG